jgi:very-short-patch-repair endonuclease
MNMLVHRARSLRHNATQAEAKLWSRLRRDQLGVKFRRQQFIGPYVVDFFCSPCRLIIEADGGQHNITVDAKRDLFLKNEGYTVLHYWNHEILGNIDGVLQDIVSHIQILKPPPGDRWSPTSPLKGEV